MDIEEKSDALYNFTLENLTQILDAGVDVGMVQVGNEINNGMCGETDASNVRKLLASGSKAVRDAAIKAVIISAVILIFFLMLKYLLLKFI